MHKIILSIFILLIAFNCLAQKINNIQINRGKDHINIHYCLSALRHSKVQAFYYTANNEKVEIKKNTFGDIGLYIAPGEDKKLTWYPADTTILTSENMPVISLEAKPFIEMVQVKKGSFMMGCTEEQIKCDRDEKRPHKVNLSSFYIGKYEITNAQYSVFLNEIGADRYGTYRRTDYIHITKSSCQINYDDGKFVPVLGKEEFPVIEVTWFGAKAFCAWAEGRLPTESEWEYAARGGHNSTTTIYSGSNKVNEVAWYDKNSRGKLHKKGQKKPNELGIYDMSGNVWEWCSDWYDDYTKREKTNPRGPDKGYGRVIRGGSWLYYGRFCRVSNRGGSSPYYCFNNYGFRLVREEP